MHLQRVDCLLVLMYSHCVTWRVSIVYLFTASAAYTYDVNINLHQNIYTLEELNDDSDSDNETTRRERKKGK